MGIDPKYELEELEREWDRLDSIGGGEERQRAIADQMLEMQIELDTGKIRDNPGKSE